MTIFDAFSVFHMPSVAGIQYDIWIRFNWFIVLCHNFVFSVHPSYE